MNRSDQSFGYVEDEDEKEMELKAAASKAPSIVMPGEAMSKKARKKAEAGMGRSMFSPPRTCR